MQSETAIVAVPTAADSWTNINTFTVPAGVKRLVRVRFNTSPDFGVSATSIRVANIYRLIGSGLQEQSPHEYVGMFGGVGGIAGGSGTYQDPGMEYEVDIPVSTGGTIDVQVNSLDEAITAGTVQCCLIYDDKGGSAKNSQSQYVDAAMTTTADAWSTVGTFTVPQMSSGNSPKKIRKVVLALAPDQGTSAISLRAAPRFRLTGSGINEGGSHEYIGPAAGNETITDGALMYDRMTVVIDVDIPVNPGGSILAEQRLAVETPTAGTVAVGLLYE